MTTQENNELFELGNTADTLLARAEVAERALRKVWEQYFTDREQKPLDIWSAEDLRYRLEIICEYLFTAITDYCLERGASGWGVEYALQQADIYRQKTKERAG